MIATLISIVVGYLVAVSSTRFGLDPDNQSVPIITSVMDLAGVITFLLVLSLLGVGIRCGRLTCAARTVRLDSRSRSAKLAGLRALGAKWNLGWYLSTRSSPFSPGSEGGLKRCGR